MHPTACPNAREFQQLVAGKVSDRRLHSLTQHIQECSKCLDVVNELAKQDEFVRVIQKAKVPACDDPIVQNVLAQWKEGREDANSSAYESDTVDACLDDTTPAGGKRKQFPFLNAPELPDELGRLGKYRILSVLGEGGMGVVFRAEDPLLEREVALKVLWSGNQVPSAMKQRFAREAKTLAAISHDNVVAVHSVEEVGDTPFLTMPLLEGETLGKHLPNGGAFSQSAVAEIGEQVATALTAAHAKGIIHRDLKPSNIWVETGGRIKLIDFGLALYDDLDLTTTGQLMGTPKYMSPEQVNGQQASVESDLFSLGVVLYELVVGRPPFTGANLTSVARAIVDGDRIPVTEALPEVDEHLAEVIEKLLRVDPSEQFRDAETVATELRRVQQRLSEPQVDSQLSKPGPERKRHIRTWIAGLVLAAALLAGLIVTIDFGDGDRVTVTFGDNATPVQIDVDERSLVITDPTDGKPVRIEVDKVNRQLRFKKDGFSVANRKFDLRTPSGRSIQVEFNSAVLNSKNAASSNATLDSHQVAVQKDAIRWVLEQGGHVILTNYEQVNAIGQVPDDPALLDVISVHLHNTPSLTDDDLAALANARIRIIYLHGAVRGECLRWLAEIETLEGIQLYRCQQFESENLKYLFGNERIEYLSADDTPVGDELSRLAASLPKLRDLALGKNATDKSIEIIATCPSLVKLTVSHSPGVTPEGLSQIIRLPHLGSLLATGKQINRQVADAFNQHDLLRILELEDPAPNAELLSRLRRIETLSFRYANLREFNLLELAKIESLTQLHLPANVDAGTLEELSKLMPNCDISTE